MIARRLAGAAVLLLAAATSGCVFLGPRVQMADTAPLPAPSPMGPPPPPATPANGSLFATATYRPLFEDHRARLVGDVLTVEIVEKPSAVQSSTSSVDKTGSLGASLTALPGVRAGAFARAGADGSTNQAFEGKGSTENSNDFSGTITVVVRQVLPNGHLLIAGEKQVGVNQNVDVLRFSGQVDPRSIRPGNSVPSAAIANVRLEQRGRGAQAEAQAMGWISRVFLSVLPI